jgi:thiamine monophosphate synthase
VPLSAPLPNRPRPIQHHRPPQHRRLAAGFGEIEAAVAPAQPRHRVRLDRPCVQAAGRLIRIQVDGGITKETAPQAIAAGASVLVAGSAVFGQEDYAQAIAALRQSLSV